MKFIPTILPLLLVASTTADLNTRSDRKLGGGKSNFPSTLSSAGTAWPWPTRRSMMLMLRS
eukprot:scaffold12011_cov67-Skeletonema_dohrnii-CCMP3373.AAC.1